MKIRFPAILASLAIGGTLLVSSAAIATATPPPAGPAGRGVCATVAVAARTGGTVDEWRAFGDCEIARRFTTLTTLATKVSGSKVLTSSDTTALTAEIASVRTGLTALKTTIDSETNRSALKADIAKVATGYRVYLLVAPQVHLANGADGILATQAVFGKVNTNLATRIATAKAAGKDTAAAQTALDAMNAAVTQAVGLAQPIPARILALTPSGWNSGTAGPILTQARADLVQARGLLQSARADAKACRDALK